MTILAGARLGCAALSAGAVRPDAPAFGSGDILWRDAGEVSRAAGSTLGADDALAMMLDIYDGGMR
jgi:hypothetical protein